MTKWTCARIKTVRTIEFVEYESDHYADQSNGVTYVDSVVIESSETAYGPTIANKYATEEWKQRIINRRGH